MKEGTEGPEGGDGEKRPAALRPSLLRTPAVWSLAGTAVLRPSDLPGGQNEPPSLPWRPKGGAGSFSAAPETRGRGTGRPPRPAPSQDLPPPRAEGRAHWLAGLRGLLPLAGLGEEHAATVAGSQSGGGGPTDGPRAARAASSGHGGCGAASGRSALAALPRPRQAASRLVFALLPWLRAPGSRLPLPRRSALCTHPGARKRRGPQCVPVGSLPGHAKTSARWVSRLGQAPGGGRSLAAADARPGGGQKDRAPGYRPRAVEAPLFGGSAQGGSPRLRRPCSYSGEAPAGRPRASGDAPTPGGGQARKLFPGSVCRTSGFPKRVPECRAPAVFSPDPVCLEAAAETLPTSCSHRSPSWGRSTRDKASRQRWPKRTPRD